MTALHPSHWLTQDGIPLPRASSLVMVKDTPKGRGIFPTRPIAAGTVVETCPVLILPVEEVDVMGRTVLSQYTYNWPVPPPLSSSPPSSTPSSSSAFSTSSTSSSSNPPFHNNDNNTTTTTSTSSSSSDTSSPHQQHQQRNIPSKTVETKTSTTQALSLGLGSLFNPAPLTSPAFNTVWTRGVVHDVIVYRTDRDVQAGEELCVCYGDGGRVWFRDVDVDADVEVGSKVRGGDRGRDGIVEAGLGRIELDV